MRARTSPRGGETSNPLPPRMQACRVPTQAVRTQGGTHLQCLGQQKHILQSSRLTVSLAIGMIAGLTESILHYPMLGLRQSQQLFGIDYRRDLGGIRADVCARI